MRPQKLQPPQKKEGAKGQETYQKSLTYVWSGWKFTRHHHCQRSIYGFVSGGKISGIWAYGHMGICEKIWSSGVSPKRPSKMQLRNVNLRSVGPSVQKLWPTTFFAKKMPCILHGVAKKDYPQDCPPQDCPLEGNPEGGQSWVHQSSGLPTPIITFFSTCYVDLGWCLHILSGFVCFFTYLRSTVLYEQIFTKTFKWSLDYRSNSCLQIFTKNVQLVLRLYTL